MSEVSTAIVAKQLWGNQTGINGRHVHFLRLEFYFGWKKGKNCSIEMNKLILLTMHYGIWVRFIITVAF